jgi:hypothetical protein
MNTKRTIHDEFYPNTKSKTMQLMKQNNKLFNDIVLDSYSKLNVYPHEITKNI